MQHNGPCIIPSIAEYQKPNDWYEQILKSGNYIVEVAKNNTASYQIKDISELHR